MLGLFVLMRRLSTMNTHTSNIPRSRDKSLSHTSRTSASVVGTAIPMELKGTGSIKRFLPVAFPFLRVTGEVLLPVNAPSAFSWRCFRTSSESSTRFQSSLSLGGASVGDGYSADNSDEENLRRSCMLMVLEMFGVVGTGSPVTIHFESLLYAPSSTAREQDNRDWQLVRIYDAQNVPEMTYSKT